MTGALKILSDTSIRPTLATLATVFRRHQRSSENFEAANHESNNRVRSAGYAGYRLLLFFQVVAWTCRLQLAFFKQLPYPGHHILFQ